MKLKKLSSIALVGTLMVGLVAAPPAASTSPATAPASAATPEKTKSTGTVVGTVTFRGEPTEGAYVTWKTGSGEEYVSTDRKGRFTMELPVGAHKLFASSPQFSVHRTYAGNTTRKPDANTIRVREGRVTLVNIDLAPAATITGRVLDGDGRPKRRADIIVVNLDRHSRSQRLKTDRDGRYTATDMARGRVRIEAAEYTASYTSDDSIVVRAKNGRTVTVPDITLVPPARGMITAKIEGPTGINGYWPETINDDGDTFELEQDADSGLWTAEVPVGPWHVTAPFSNIQTKAVTVKDGETAHAGRLVFPSKRGVLTGKVRVPKGQTFRAGEVVAIPQSGWGTRHGRIKKDGSFKVKRMSPGTYFVHAIVHANDYDSWETKPVRIEVTAGKKTKKNFAFPRQHTVRGRVVHQGKPVRGVAILLSPSNGYARTDAQGRFTIRLVPRGKYTVQIRDTSPEFRFKEIPLTVRGDVKGLKIKLKK